MHSLTGLELACGRVSGVSAGAPDRSTAPVRASGPPVSAFAALEAAVLPAVLASPCVVSFSGGKDSALVLAVAARVARREGLPLPIPVSWRFPDVPRADESTWQDRILTELRIEDRIVLAAGDDLDLVGPVARSVLRRHGVLYPANLHLHEPILGHARRGALLTGLGGDQVLTCWSAAGRVSLRRTARVVAARGPWWVRVSAAAMSRSGSFGGAGGRDFPWLRRDAARRAFLDWLGEWMGRPDRPDRRLWWESRRRRLTVAADNLASLGADQAVTVLNPLLDRAFHASLVGTVPAGIRMDRSALIRLFCGDRIPPIVYRHRPKGWFREVFVRTPTLTLAREWDGRGADESLVDPAVLAELWRHAPFPAGTGSLLQQAWVHRTGGGSTDGRTSARRPDAGSDSTDVPFR